METILYGHKASEPAYMEQIIKVWQGVPDDGELAKVEQWADDHGYEIRLHVIDLSVPPNFTQTVNV